MTAARPWSTPGQRGWTEVHLQGADTSVWSSRAWSRSRTCEGVSLTSWRSGSLLCRVEGVGWQKTPTGLSAGISPCRGSPPPASCRDGSVQPHSLQLEMEGSRWPCLAQIPARLSGRCGRRDRVGASSGNIGEEGGSCLLAVLVGPCLRGGSGDHYIVVLEPAGARSSLARDVSVLYSQGTCSWKHRISMVTSPAPSTW